jgi:transcriptional regulator with XRE-family HTH domain
MDARRSELGDFLRSRRQGLRPEAVGLPATRRRRTPGLRREEVAELAGIGIDWYVRLEQGRSVNPSLTTIDALARALRLGKTEHNHLRALARHGDHRAFAKETVPDAIRLLVESLPQPAYITGRRWDVLAWNKAAEEIFAFGRMAEEDRNTLISMLTKPASRRLFGATWADEAKRMVAMFRKTHDLWAGDPAFVDLLDRLRRDSPEFSGWWKSHDIRDVAAGEKRIVHPKKGVLRFQHASFQCNDEPGLKLVIYTPIPSS